MLASPTGKELMDQTAKSSKSAPAVDGRTFFELKHIPIWGWDLAAELFDQMENGHLEWPLAIADGLTVLLPKGDSPTTDTAAQRPMTIMLGLDAGTPKPTAGLIALPRRA